MATYNCLVLLLCLGVRMVEGDPATVQYIAENLEPVFTVVSNWVGAPAAAIFDSELVLRNAGDEDITYGDWDIFFCHIRLFEPGTLTPNYTEGIPLGETRLDLYHVNGCLYKLRPTEEFRLDAGDVIKATIRSSDWMVARTDVMPNWYVSTGLLTGGEGGVPGEEGGPTVATIAFTRGEELQHAGEFNTPEQWKRTPSDTFNPPTLEDRYEEYADGGDGATPNRLLPSPLEVSLAWTSPIPTDDKWVIIALGDTTNEALYLSGATGWSISGSQPASGYARLQVDVGLFSDGECAGNDEAYHVRVDEESRAVEVIGATRAGVFYGVQTLLGILDLHGDDSLYPGTILDCPRFSFRGFMIDVSRNFHTKETILGMLKVMATYKLNKFHFHLTDDEGWRLEIDGLPELTEIGGEQCHNLAENECIIPQLGSPPEPTQKTYYTRDDYIEILQEAQRLHIEVIPEFDMPGHGHAAIKAMEARFHRLNSTDPEGAREYLLSDFDDESQYYTAQHFTDSAFNPCVPSTAVFIGKIIQEVRSMHDAAGVPLWRYHFGGDEVPGDAWKGSPACQRLIAEEGFTDHADLKRYFFDMVVNASYGVDPGLWLGSWEDGVMDAESNPFPPVRDVPVYTNCWSNVWEWGHGERAYQFANKDFPVVLSHATHLYFDHPQEPDPHERGYYWATRVTPTEKTFGYMPDDIYANIDTNRMGESITEEDVCGEDGCLRLDESKRHNIIGMQGQVWTETVRTQDHLHEMVLPRLLALAERAWHKAEWEGMPAGEREAERRRDWEEFSRLLGTHELHRLGERYHLRPPGAKISNAQLLARSEFPGLSVEYRVNDGVWMTYTSPVTLPEGDSSVQLRTSSADGRYSRTVTLKADVTSAATSSNMTSLLAVISMTVLYWLINY